MSSHTLLIHPIFTGALARLTFLATAPIMAYERFKGLGIDTELVRRVGITLSGIQAPAHIVQLDLP